MLSARRSSGTRHRDRGERANRHEVVARTGSRAASEEVVDLVLVALVDVDLDDLAAAHAIGVRAADVEHLIDSPRSLADEHDYVLRSDESVDHLDLDAL